MLKRYKHFLENKDWKQSEYDSDNTELESYLEADFDGVMYTDFDEVNDKYFFHGTSTIFHNSIMKEGLKNPIYITRNHELAFLEASYKVSGDKSDAAFKKPSVGGEIIVYVIDKTRIDEKELAIDPGYPNPMDDQAFIYQKHIDKCCIVDYIVLEANSKWHEYEKETKYFSTKNMNSIISKNYDLHRYRHQNRN